MRTLCPLLLLAVLLECGCPARISEDPPALPEFTSGSATNALAAATELVRGFTPRDAGTDGARNASVWIRDELAKRGVKAELNEFNQHTPRGLLPMRNVIGTIPGSGDRWIVLLSHFDTVSTAPVGFEGANDGASSTGLLLELGRLLQSSAPLRHSVMLGFTDGEECMLAYTPRDGLHGSKRIAADLKRRRCQVDAVILLDMVGDRDLKLRLPYNSSAKLRVLALEAADAVGLRDYIGLYDGHILDDHQSFLDVGFPAVDLIDFEFGSAPGLNDYWHTAADTLDKISADSLLVTGKIVMEMIRRLDAAD